MKDDQFKAWKLTREKSKLNFFLIRGVLSYGLPMLIIMAFMNKPFVDGFTSKAAIVHIIVWSLAGLLFGVTMWYVTEHKYKKELASRTYPKG
ncbi:hypothetical protein [Shewanella polaris]|uniref:DUF485 domain-containing protein n=1 Tax=Shewanella polaris TaxID=2588449 RepID=A0A4Y5YE00_9GAMM|nr:hypothetical protein [Shewanella polaris]QDE30763.1 hypothetical protein FH971_07170 [Shewanella polaris]